VYRSAPRPSGVSLGRALTVGPGIVNSTLREVVTIIDRVHGDGELPPIPMSFVSDLKNPRGHSIDGAFIYDIVEDETIVARSIRIRQGTPQISFVALHEIGHFIDAVALPSRGFASEDDPALRSWRRAVVRSRLYHHLERIAATADSEVQQRAVGLMTPVELWARGYAQFVAVRSGNESLRRALWALRLRSATDLYFPRQWDDDDFLEIESTIDELFRSLGWIVT
jgi:hypothetical protein